MSVLATVNSVRVNGVDDNSDGYTEKCFGLRTSNLRRMRRACGYTLDDAAKLVGVSVSYLSRLESGGRRIQPYLVDRFVEVYKCTRRDVLGDMVNGLYMPNVFAKLPNNERSRRQHGYFKYYEALQDSVLPKKTMPIYTLTTRYYSDKVVFFLERKAPYGWIYRPRELADIMCFGLICGEALPQYFSSKGILYLAAAEALDVGDIVLLCSSDGTLMLLKCVSGTDASSTIRAIPAFSSDCDSSNKEKLIDVSSSDFEIYKVVGFQDFFS